MAKPIDRESSPETDQIDLIDDWIEAYENHVIRGGPAPEDYPEGLSDKDQRLIDESRRAVDALQQAFDSDKSSSDRPAEESPPQQLGDFRILREIGRGGMGVVYEAEQISIKRTVALKILPFAAMLDEKRLERFKNEVRAAATLDHPACVPIYVVGEERGVHYYAMKLIRGQSLAQVIDEFKNRDSLSSTQTEATDAPLQRNISSAHSIDVSPNESSPNTSIDGTTGASASVLSISRVSHKRDYFRQIAALGAQTASALHHAHEQGVIHRDVKPGNLLLDVKGNIWVTDFGLARIEADAGVTMAGDLIGTLRYMSPEQALDKPALVDHRVDIYSLGATLYELLTMQPAVRGDNRAQMLKHFAENSPIALRKIDPLIPVELETIVIKAMEPIPTDRYTTAAELAEDLRRFLEHKPILAKRSTPLGRTSKWIRRYPILTALIAVVMVGLASVAGLSLRHSSELVEINSHLSESLTESEELRKSLESQQSTIRRSKYLLDMRVANQSMLDGQYEAARSRLEQYLPASSSAEERDFPWYYLWDQYKKSKKDFLGHTGMVRSCTLAPNSELVISAGDDGTVRFFNQHTLQQTAMINGFNGKVYAVAVTADEQTLFTAGEGGELLAWNIEEVAAGNTPTKITRLKGHSDDVLCLAISPDGNHLASAGHDGQVLVWELPTLKLASRLDGHTDWVRCLDFSPDSETLASISHDDYLILWNITQEMETLRIKVVEEGHPIGLSVRFHPNGDFIAVGNSPGDVQIIRLIDSEVVSKIKISGSWIRSLDFSDDGRMLVASGNNPSIHLLRVNDRLQMKRWLTLPGHQLETWCVRFVNGTRSVLSTGIDGRISLARIRLENTFHSRIAKQVPKVIAPDEVSRTLTTSRDHKNVLLTGLHGAWVYDVKNLQNKVKLGTSQNYYFDGTFSHNGRWIGYSQWSSIIYTTFDKSHENMKLGATSNENSYSSFSFHPSKDLMAAGTRMGQFSVVEIPSQKEIMKIMPCGKVHISDVMYTSDGRYVAASFFTSHDLTTATLVVWDAESLAEHCRVQGVKRLLATSFNGCNLALINLDNTISIWNADAKTTINSFDGHSDKVLSCDFSPDGKYLLSTATSGPIKLWSMETGQLVLDMDEQLLYPHAIFTSNRSAVATDIRPFVTRGKTQYRHFPVSLLDKP